MVRKQEKCEYKWPRRSARLIPQEVMDVYENYMTIISPIYFVSKHEGTNTEWHKTAIIPPVNIKLASYGLSRNKNSLFNIFK